jgi:1-acyl-sn-glycerol-3-phosphate acyltransferase
MLLLRSLLFNLAFYGWTMILCVALFWMLFIPRRRMIAVVTWYLGTLAWLERTIIGLNYQVLGREHLPAGGCYLVAAKHQSVWETMKLHALLGDPAIVLKWELLFLPFWGWYAAKAGLIAVRRGAKGAAVASLLRGARRVRAEGRPIVIFPQGTRVAPGDYRPYKVGISVLYDDLQVPVIPMAVNSGLFWRRRGFLRRPGLITVQFLPAIPPGLPGDVMRARLEAELESASDGLVPQALRRKQT